MDIRRIEGGIFNTEKDIGYAWLPVKHTELGTHAAVETPEGMRDATIAPMPVFDPEKQIPKS